ncbi:hypothetical protein, partial [Escherichia coli]|uniref:hypothetical protein n=2 Tax=Escherichia coli TaxID=562 RepID=UPI002897169E
VTSFDLLFIISNKKVLAIAGGMLIINPLHEINNGTHLQTGVHYRKRLNLAISLNLNEKTRWHVTGNRPHDVRDHLTP